MMMWNTFFHLLYIFTVPFIIVPRSAVSYSDSSEESRLNRIYFRLIDVSRSVRLVTGGRGCGGGGCGGATCIFNGRYNTYDSSDEEHSCTRLYKRCMRPGIPSNPVCGTDGKTYSHVCRLYYTNCWLYDDRILRKAYDGPCIQPTFPRPRPPPPRPPPPRPSPPRSPPSRPPVTSQPLPPPGPPPLPPTTRDPIAEATPSKCDFLCPETGPNMMVCGSDGVTYLSECYLEWLNCRRGTQITVAYPGPCLDFGTLAPIPPLRPTIGPTVVDGNGGALPGIGVGNPTNGVPTPPCSQYCPLESDPVCGTDGITYISPCLLEVQACVKRDPGLKIWYRGVCDETQSKHSGTERPCPRLETCPLLYLPVCGSDGITYQTECHLLAKACSSQDPRDRGLQVSFVGECSDLNTPSFCGTCSEIWQPVCGFDNVTYYSECHLRQYACENNLIYLKVAYRSICKAGLIECPDYCPIGVNDPVCGTDGNTYPSLCFLAHAACINNDKMLTLKHRGECSTDPCERKCPEDVYQPVCSSAGDTYQNDCFLWVAMCRDNSISRAGPSDGTCNLAIP